MFKKRRRIAKFTVDISNDEKFKFGWESQKKILMKTSDEYHVFSAIIIIRMFLFLSLKIMF